MLRALNQRAFLHADDWITFRSSFLFLNQFFLRFLFFLWIKFLFLEFKTDGGTEEECTWIKTRLMYRKKSCSSFQKRRRGVWGGPEEDKRGKNASDKFADAATFMRCQLEMNYYFVCTEKPYVHIVLNVFMNMFL